MSDPTQTNPGYVIFYNEDETRVVAILRTTLDAALDLVDHIPADACDQAGFDAFASIHPVDNLVINPL